MSWNFRFLISIQSLPIVKASVKLVIPIEQLICYSGGELHGMIPWSWKFFFLFSTELTVPFYAGWSPNFFYMKAFINHRSTNISDVSFLHILYPNIASVSVISVQRWTFIFNMFYSFCRELKITQYITNSVWTQLVSKTFPQVYC